MKNGGISKVCDCKRKVWAKCGHSWHFNFKVRGGPSYRFSVDTEAGKHIDSKTEANALADTWRTAIRAGTFRRRGDVPPVVTPSTPDAITFASFGEIYLTRRGKPATSNDTSHMRRLMTFALPGPCGTQPFGDKFIGAITEDDIELFFVHLREEGRAAGTKNKYVQLVKAMFRWATKKGYLPRNPISDDSTIIKRDKGAKRDRRLVPDVINPTTGAIEREGEERRLLAVANPALQRLIIGALETGMRRGELLSLQWQDVDMQRRELTVRAENTKTDEARHLPISSRLAGILEMARTDPTGREFGPLNYVFGDTVGRKVATTKQVDTRGASRSFWPSSCIVCGRSLGSFCRQARMISSNACGSFALVRLEGGTGCL